MAAEPRHDFFQTDKSVIISIYVKGCRAEDVKCDIASTKLEVTIAQPSPATSLSIAPLYSPISPETSSYQVLGSKIEVTLRKASVGVQWSKLKGENDGESAASAPIASTSTTSSSDSRAAPRPRSKWDSLKLEDENGKVEDEAGVDDFFKKLYADADDDTRRAMMKSYQESGGTALSTNWDQVKKAKVETKPPEGMEAREW